MQKYLDLKEFSIYICPSSKRWSHRLMVRTSPFHGGNMGSSPVGITNTKRPLLAGGLFVLVTIPPGNLKPYYLGNYELEDKV